jgi:putative ABC transport system permease protein
VGLVLSTWSVPFLVAILPPSGRRLSAIGLDRGVLGFGFAITLAAGLLFSLTPALRAAKTAQISALRAAGRSTGGPARRRLGAALVVGEVAVALTLLAASGLMVRSVRYLQHVDPGFEPTRLLTIDVPLPAFRYRSDREIREFYALALDRLTGLPGVEGVAATTVLPRSRSTPTAAFTIEGREPAGPGQETRVNWIAVTSDYFRTLGVPVRGRAFDRGVGADAPLYALVNEAAARRFWPGEDPIGRRAMLNGRPREIVGVAGNVLQSRLADERAELTVYVPFEEAPSPDATLVLRAAADPARLAPDARRLLRQLDADLPIGRIATMTQHIEGQFAGLRIVLALLTIFDVLALALASGGIYGLLAYAVSRRTHEIGLRMALGARYGDVVGLVVRQGMTLVAVGALLGLAGAALVARALGGVLFGVRPLDPATFSAVVAVVTVVAFAACWIPARRAARVDPLGALRSE